MELQNLVQTKYPDSIVTRVEGVEKDERGGEVLLLIEEDDELDAYLSHMHGKKASFLICLSPKVWWKYSRPNNQSILKNHCIYYIRFR